jgi:hypothetical protein
MQASAPWDDVAFSSAERDRHLGLDPLYLSRGVPCERSRAPGALGYRVSE